MYISGYITRQIVKQETCVSCSLELKNSKCRGSSAFLDIRNKGGLLHPPVGVIYAVKVANSIFEQLSDEILNNHAVAQFDKAVNQAVKFILESKPSLLGRNF